MAGDVILPGPMVLNDKSAVVKALRDMGTLKQIKGENSFKTRAYDIAADRIAGLSDDIGERDLALVWAAEHGGDVAAHLDAVGAGTIEDRHEALDAFVDAGIDVLAVEGFRSGGEDRHFRGADRPRPFVALQIRHQHRINHAGLAP